MRDIKTIQDLLEDQSFLNWVDQSNAADVAKWNEWRADNPSRQHLLEQGKTLVEGIVFHEKEVPADVVNANWSRLADGINSTADKPQVPSNAFPRRFIILGLLLLGLLGALGVKYLVTTEPPQLMVYKTGADMTEEVVLPDGSKVTLNTNSSIEFLDNMSDENERMVRLSGEGFFNVAKQPEGSTFQVSTKDIEIIVIGTSFNLNSKRSNTVVSLTEGKVQVKKGTAHQLKLNEGESASFDPQSQVFTVENGQSKYWRSWKDGHWSFGTGVALHEVLTRIEETYSVTCVINDESLLTRKASGDVSVESREVLLEALSVLLDVNIQSQDGKLIFSTLQ